MTYHFHRYQGDLSDFFDQVFTQQYENFFQEIKPREQKEIFQFVLEKEQQILAVASCQRLYETLKICDFAVKSQYQRKGLGRCLLKEIKNFAKKSGLKTIILTTRSYQTKDFYLKQDFQVYGSLDDLPFKGVKTYYMAYRVD